MNFHFSPEEQDILSMLHDFCEKEVGPLAAEIDEEVKAIIDRAYARCEEILTARREALTVVAEYLLAHETMTGEEFERMVGEKA